MVDKFVKKEKPKKKKKIKVQKGIAHILTTFNNTIVNISDEQGNTLVSYSPAKFGFKNTKKRTAYAATKAATSAASYAMEKYGLEEVKVYIKGAGQGRNAAVKGLASAGLRVTMIADLTKLPHNGCRAKKVPHDKR